MRCIAVALALCWLGCATNRHSRLEERLAEAADERDRFCDEEVEQADADVLRAVQSAEPLYVNVKLGKSSYETMLLGARLWIVARQGWTAQWLERTLRCHQARLVLQPGANELAPPGAFSLDGEDAGVRDPFWLAGSFIDIEVVPERSAFVAILRVNRVEEGKQVYAQARDFVAKIEFPGSDDGRGAR